MKKKDSTQIYVNVLAPCLFSALSIFGCQPAETQEAKTPKAIGIKASNIQPLTKHWEKAISLQSPPRGLTCVSAEECGKCHDDIYEEWKNSFHAVACQDPQFQSEWAKDDSLGYS